MQIKSGVMLSEIAFSNLPVIFKNVGFDFFIIDYEHGGFDYGDMARLIMVAKLTQIEVIVRLANNERKDITKILDMGAEGLLLPMTNSIEDIQQVVAYAKYAPIGKRGISTMRAHTLYNPPKINDYLEIANHKTKVYAQIETQKGLENVQSILKTEGVNGVILGPNDYACDCHCLGDANAKCVIDAIEVIAKEAKALGKEAGIITTNQQILSKAKEADMTLLCVGSELSMIKSAASEIMKQIKG